MDQVTSLLEERPDDAAAVRKAMDLQDNINGIYDRRDTEDGFVDVFDDREGGGYRSTLRLARQIL